MFVKLLTALAVLGAILWMLRPRQSGIGGHRQPPAPRVPHVDDLEKCARCGIWLPAGTRCDCEARGQAPAVRCGGDRNGEP
jgi:hypothetical protein